jgi:DinB family protein
MGDDKFGACVEVLQATPEKIRVQVKGLSEEQLRYKAEAKNFSVKENISHLRDLEIEGFGKRLRLILAEKLPTLGEIDGARLAVVRRYQSADMSQALEEFCRARSGNVAYLRNMTAFQWNRKALLNGEEITLLQLVEMWVEHDQDHLKQMEVLLEQINVPAA